MITAHLLKQPRTALTSERVARRLTTILAADVAGYSRLTGLDEEGSRERRAGADGNRKAAARSHPDGHPVTDHGRLHRDAPDQSRCGAAIDPDYRGHLLCAQWRRKEGAGGWL